MEKGLKYTLVVIKKFGFRGILYIVSIVSWFFLPFVVWIQISEYFGEEYFAIKFAIPGLILTVPFTIFVVLLFVGTVSLDRKLMRHVEHTNSVFNNPADPNSEYDFRRECNKFIVPYLYFPKMALYGLSGIFGTIGICRRAVIRIIQILVQLYLGYSISAFLVSNQPVFNQIWGQLSPVIPYSHEIGTATQAFLLNAVLSMTLLLLLSLYFNPALSCAREGYVTYSGVFWEVAFDSFSIINRLYTLVIVLIGLPIRIQRKRNSLKYEPFTFPTNLPLIIQKSVWNIERVVCKVTKWPYTVKDEKDMEVLKKMTYDLKEFPSLIRLMASRADSKRALNVISKLKPILYLGTIDERCSILARIEYDSKEKMFRANLFFDNRYIRDEFESIAEIEIAEQKRLKQQLPNTLTAVISQLGLGK